MFIGTVQCEIELAKAHPAFEGFRFLLIHADHDVEWEGDIVAIDTMGARVGDMVAVALAPLGAKFDIPDDLPIDAAVVGIVGSITTPAEEGDGEKEEPAVRSVAPTQGPRSRTEERPRRPVEAEAREEPRRDAPAEDRRPREGRPEGRRDEGRRDGPRRGDRGDGPRREERMPEAEAKPAREAGPTKGREPAVNWDDAPAQAPAPTPAAAAAPAAPAGRTPRGRDTWPAAEKPKPAASDDGGFDVVWESGQAETEPAAAVSNVKSKRGGARRRR